MSIYPLTSSGWPELVIRKNDSGGNGKSYDRCSNNRCQIGQIDTFPGDSGCHLVIDRTELQIVSRKRSAKDRNKKRQNDQNADYTHFHEFPVKISRSHVKDKTIVRRDRVDYYYQTREQREEQDP